MKKILNESEVSALIKELLASTDNQLKTLTVISKKIKQMKTKAEQNANSGNRKSSTLP